MARYFRKVSTCKSYATATATFGNPLHSFHQRQCQPTTNTSTLSLSPQQQCCNNVMTLIQYNKDRSSSFPTNAWMVKLATVVCMCVYLKLLFLFILAIESNSFLFCFCYKQERDGVIQYTTPLFFFT